jgi:transcription elongation GreA/GreB family factor
VLLAQQKIKELNSILNDAQEAANNETKSSAGDKHETGRAMAQLETEKLTTQLTEALKIEQTLQQINPNIVNQQISLGALVITNNGDFYLAAGLGKIEIDNTLYFVISTAAPVGQKLIGLTKNNSFTFNDKKYNIIDVQ